MKSYSIIIFLVSFLTTQLKCQEISVPLKKELNRIYDQSDKSPEFTYEGIESPYNHLIFAQKLRWKYIPIHESKDSILDLYKESLLVFEAYKPNNSLDSISKISSYLLLAEYYYNQKQYYRSFQEAYRVYNYIEDKLEQPIEEIESLWLLPVSLYHYYFGYYKEKNSLLSPLMWPLKKGEKEKGLIGLQKLATKSSVSQTEALIYLSHIYLRIEDQPDIAHTYALKLHQKHPSNLKFMELLIESNISMKVRKKENQQMIRTLLNSDKIYYQKYGVAYDALNKVTFTDLDEEKKQILIEALKTIEELGGGQHLNSLLYKALYEISKSQSHKELLDENKQYTYSLTKPHSS